MELRKKSKLICAPQLEDVPELIQRIQSLLPVEEAARSCVLSKSWLHAWSTIPNLKFTKHVSNDYVNLIDRTLNRYLRDNLSIKSFLLDIKIKNEELASLVERWIRQVVSKSSLKEFYFTFRVKNFESFLFTLPYEIFSGENLTTISLKCDSDGWTNDCDWITSNPGLIKCVSLRVLELIDVNIGEDELHSLISACPVLETLTVQLNTCDTLENLDITCVPLKRFNLRMMTDRETYVEVFAQSLPLFCYEGKTLPNLSFPGDAPQKIQLTLELQDPVDCSFFLKLSNTFNLSSKFDIEIVNFNPVFLVPMNIQIVKKSSDFLVPINIKIVSETRADFVVPMNIDIDDLRIMVSLLAMNVEEVSFEMFSYGRLSHHLEYFDAFVSICRPTCIKAYQDMDFNNKYFCKQMVREVMYTRMKARYWPDLKDVEIINPHTGDSEDLNSYRISSPGETILGNKYYVEFKLNWRSP